VEGCREWGCDGLMAEEANCGGISLSQTTCLPEGRHGSLEKGTGWRVWICESMGGAPCWRVAFCLLLIEALVGCHRIGGYSSRWGRRVSEGGEGEGGKGGASVFERDR